VDADQLEHPGWDRAARRLRRKISCREPGAKSGAGEDGSEGGCEKERFHED
jgi:hypothetical protein